MSGPEVSAEHGRHRRSRAPWLLPLVALLALAIGFGAGVVVTQGDQQRSTAEAAPTVPLSTVPGLPTAGVSSPGGTAAPGIPAPPDPSASDAGDVASYLAALERAQVPVGSNRDVVLALGRQVCQQPPERRADPAGLGGQIAAVFPGLWSPAQASALVTAADDVLC